MATRPLKLQPTTNDEAMNDLVGAGVNAQTQAEMNAGVNASSPAGSTSGVTATSEPRTKLAGPTGVPTVSNRDADQKALEKRAREFGKSDGEGKRAFVSFARLLVQGGMSDVLSPSAKSQDASRMYGAFSSSSATAAGGLSDEKKASTASQLSKVRAFIRLGKEYKDDGEAIFDDALEVHRTIMATPELSENVKLRSTYAAACSIAVAQTKGVTKDFVPPRLTIDQIKGLMLNEPKEEHETTGADILIQALNLTESAMRGRAATDNRPARDPVVHDDLPLVVETLRNVISSADPKALAERDQKIADLIQKRAEAAQKKAEADAEKAAKAKEKEIQDALKASGETSSAAPTNDGETDEDTEQGNVLGVEEEEEEDFDINQQVDELYDNRHTGAE
jgi:hypothetical protein